MISLLDYFQALRLNVSLIQEERMGGGGGGCRMSGHVFPKTLTLIHLCWMIIFLLEHKIQYGINVDLNAPRSKHCTQNSYTELKSYGKRHMKTSYTEYMGSSQGFG